MKAFSTVDLMIGVVAAFAVASAVTAGCYVSVSDKPCCDIIPSNAFVCDSGPQMCNTTGCDDQITSNPPVAHYRDAVYPETGKQNLTVSETACTCKWDNYVVNAAGNCVFEKKLSNIVPQHAVWHTVCT